MPQSEVKSEKATSARQPAERASSVSPNAIPTEGKVVFSSLNLHCWSASVQPVLRPQEPESHALLGVKRTKRALQEGDAHGWNARRSGRRELAPDPAVACYSNRTGII